MSRAQGELRGPKGERRSGGGDWDANADDFAAWVEPEPGEVCKCYLVGEDSILIGDTPTRSGLVTLCTNMAPVGSSICTPCHRRRIRTRYRGLSLAHRRRIALQTGRPLEEIR